jgi:anti-anti-sigma factor
LEECGEILLERDAGAWVFRLRGEVDVSVKPTLTERLAEPFEAGGGSAVVVDLSEAAFVDSTVLKGLVYGMEKTAQCERPFAIVAPLDGMPRRLLALTALEVTAPIFLTRRDALAAVAPE